MAQYVFRREIFCTHTHTHIHTYTYTHPSVPPTYLDVRNCTLICVRIIDTSN